MIIELGKLTSISVLLSKNQPHQQNEKERRSWVEFLTEWQLQMVSMSRGFYLYISSWEQLRHLNGYSWNILFQIHFSGQYEKYGQFPWQRK